MIFMFIPLWLAAMLPSLLGGVVNAFTSQGQINRMNRYNDPRSQLQRLNAAGLPFAAFSQGQAGNQSSLPDLSGIGEGISNVTGAYFTTQIQKKQVELVQEQVRAAKAAANIAERNDVRDAEDYKADFMEGQVIDGQMITNRHLAKRMDYEMKNFSWWIQKHESDMKKIEAMFMDSQYKSGRMKEIADQEFEQLINKNKLMKQVWDNTDKQNAARNVIIGKMQENGLNFAEALLLVLVNALSGTAKFGGSSIGF